MSEGLIIVTENDSKTRLAIIRGEDDPKSSKTYCWVYDIAHGTVSCPVKFQSLIGHSAHVTWEPYEGLDVLPEILRRCNGVDEEGNPIGVLPERKHQ